MYGILKLGILRLFFRLSLVSLNKKFGMSFLYFGSTGKIILVYLRYSCMCVYS
jgi:hypothetical protein